MKKNFYFTICLFMFSLCIYLPFAKKVLRIRDIFFYFFLTMLLIYLIYVFIQIFTLLFVIITKGKVSYFSIYPFSYHKKIKFEPDRLLFTDISIRDFSLINLALSNKDNFFDEKVYKYAKFIRIRREFSYLLSLILISILVNIIFKENVIYYYAFSYIFLFIQSYLKAPEGFESGRYIINNKLLPDLYYEKFYLEEFNINDYAKYIEKIENSISKNPCSVQRIIKNYLYSCIDSNKTILKSNTLERILLYFISLDSKLGYVFYSQTLYIIFLLGFTGKFTNNLEYIEASKYLVRMKKVTILENKLLENTDTSLLDDFILYLDNKNKDLNYNKYISLNGISAFDREDRIIRKIMNNK